MGAVCVMTGEGGVVVGVEEARGGEGRGLMELGGVGRARNKRGVE